MAPFIRSVPRRARGTSAALSIAVLAGFAHAQTGFYGVGQFPGSTGRTDIWGLSGDGQIAVGVENLPTFTYNPIRWSLATGLQILPGGRGEALAANSDGSIICGHGGSPQGACRWLPGNVLEPIPGRPVGSIAKAISPDGNVIAGNTQLSTSAVGFIWTASGGVQMLPHMPGMNRTHMFGVSADGAVAVGESFYEQVPPGPGNLPEQAVRWTAATGTQSLGAGRSTARAVTPDGSLVVGPGQSAGFYWTAPTGPQTIPGLSSPWAVSSDGRVIVGYQFINPSTRAAMWTPALGTVILNTYLPAIGISVPAGWNLTIARAVSADGSVIAGLGEHNGMFEGWVVRLPRACYVNCDNSTAAPTLNINDFVCFQNRFAAGDSYANCDASTGPPILNVNDFICFQTRFAAGCP